MEKGYCTNRIIMFSVSMTTVLWKEAVDIVNEIKRFIAFGKSSPFTHLDMECL